MNAQETVLSPEEQAELSHRFTKQRDGRRARMILLAVQGHSQIEIARLTGFSLPLLPVGASVFKRCDWMVCSVGIKRPCRPTSNLASLNRLLSLESTSHYGAIAACHESPGSQPPAHTGSDRQSSETISAPHLHIVQ